MRIVLMVGAVLLLAACASSQQGSRPFSGAFVGVNGDLDQANR